jgi:hypothetical protein
MWFDVLRRRGAWRTNVQCSMTRSGEGLDVLRHFYRMTSGRQNLQIQAGLLHYIMFGRR